MKQKDDEGDITFEDDGDGNDDRPKEDGKRKAKDNLGSAEDRNESTKVAMGVSERRNPLLQGKKVRNISPPTQQLSKLGDIIKRTIQVCSRKHNL